MATQRICSIPNCGKVHLARGFCESHYAKWKKYGDPLEVRHIPAKIGCKIDGCHDGGRLKLGYCNKHYIRFKKFGDPLHLSIAEAGTPVAFIDDLVASRSWPSDECITWPFGLKDGYGALRVGGKPTAAHIVICERIHGPAPERGYEVRHTCGKGIEGCVNPNHLAWGTHAENMADCIAHGSMNPPRGSKQWMAKLSEDDVRAIRAAVKSGETQTAVGKRYGVHQTAISAIMRGKKWAWLK